MSSLVQATNARYEFSANDQSLTGGFISIVVGSVESEATFIVHERLICETSEFVKRAMGGEWKESRQRLIRLPDQSPRVFHIYVQWLYLHVLPTRDDSEHSYGEYDQLARAYILGDILLDTSFRDAVIDAMARQGFDPESRTVDYRAYIREHRGVMRCKAIAGGLVYRAREGNMAEDMGARQSGERLLLRPCSCTTRQETKDGKEGMEPL